MTAVGILLFVCSMLHHSARKATRAVANSLRQQRECVLRLTVMKRAAGGSSSALERKAGT